MTLDHMIRGTWLPGLAVRKWKTSMVQNWEVQIEWLCVETLEKLDVPPTPDYDPSKKNTKKKCALGLVKIIIPLMTF